MFPFETFPTTDDDVAVLAAYAAAEEEVDQARKAQDALARAERKAAGAATVAVEVESAVAVIGETADIGVDVDDDFDGEAVSAGTVRSAIWIPRLRTVEGVAADRMAPTHGRLIAHGLLQFQLLSQTAGVVYRLTPAGRQVLAAEIAESAAVTDAA